MRLRQYGNDGRRALQRWRGAVCVLLCACGLAMARVEDARAQAYELRVWNEVSGQEVTIPCFSLADLQGQAAIQGLLFPMTHATITVLTEQAYDDLCSVQVLYTLVYYLNRCLRRCELGGPLAAGPLAEFLRSHLRHLLRNAYLLLLLSDDVVDGADRGHGDDPGPGGGGAPGGGGGGEGKKRDHGDDGQDRQEGSSGHSHEIHKRPCLGGARSGAALQAAGRVVGVNVSSVELARSLNASHVPDKGVPFKALSWLDARPACGAAGALRSAW